MQVTCPNCKKVLQAPEKWAGQVVKCPACKRPITLPAKEEEENVLGFDLGELGSVEEGGEAVQKTRRWRRKMSLKEAQAASGEQEDELVPSDPRVRVCPRCRTNIRHDDIYSSLICRSCGETIPGLEGSDETAAIRYTNVNERIRTTVTFYTGFMSAALYPIGAIEHIVKAMAIAMSVIAVPLLIMLGFTQSSSLNSLVQRGDTAAWVGIFLTVAFLVEAAYLGSVAYHAMIDTIRITSAGSEKTAPLTWNPASVGAALGGYIALLVFYALILLALIGHVPKSIADVQSVTTTPWKLVIVALLTFGVPMNVIGLASSHAMDGLNLVRVFKSIAAVIGQYTFLFLIVLLYLGVYIGVMNKAMSWAGPAIMESARKGLANGFVTMLMGIVAWAAVMGLGFYFAYSLGRILGLFSRTYKAQLSFEL